MPSSMIKRSFRNPTSVAVSLFVLLVTLLGSAFADEDFEGPRERRRLPPRDKPVPAQVQRHDTKFKAVPESKLEIRAIAYDGSVNGSLTVQIKNSTKLAQKFSAAGLYFVPEGNVDQAPQRLGAVGPMRFEASKETSELQVAAGATVEVQLDVFCIDSHRSAPTTANVFNVGATKMPKELTRTIETGADLAVASKRKAGDKAPRPAAKGEIQSEVWKSRDAKWIKLDGEGAQEATK